MGDQNDVIGAANQVIALAFDLADEEFSLLPGQLQTALMSPDVQASIKKTLQQFAETKIKTDTTVVSAQESQKLLDSLQTGIKDATLESLGKQIKQTPQFKKLENSLKEFEKEVKSSTLGIFVDRNKKILYVIGAALVVAGAGTLYITKSGGDIVQKPIDLLKNKQIEVLSIGSFKLSAGITEFKPDARIFGTRIEMVQNWEQVSVTFKLGVLAEGAKIQEVTGEAIVKSKDFSLNANAIVSPYTQKVNLGLKLNYNPNLGEGVFNLSAGAFYKDDILKGNLGASYQTKDGIKFGVDGNFNQNQKTGIGYEVMFGLSIPLGSK